MHNRRMSHPEIRTNESNAYPYVGGIIQRQHEGRTQLLIQTRWKPEGDPKYSGTFEFPAGVLDGGFENIYDVLAREIKEETNLTLKAVIDDSRTEVMRPQGDDASFAFRPFCCTQQLVGGLPWVGFVFLCEVEDGAPVGQKEEVRDPRWVDADEVRGLVEKSPEKFFTLELPAWKYYFADSQKDAA